MEYRGMEGPRHKRLATHGVPKGMRPPPGGHPGRDNQCKLCIRVLPKAVPHWGSGSTSKAWENNGTKVYPRRLEADNPTKCPWKSN